MADYDDFKRQDPEQIKKDIDILETNLLLMAVGSNLFLAAEIMAIALVFMNLFGLLMEYGQDVATVIFFLIIVSLALRVTVHFREQDVSEYSKSKRP